jgi:hypothetical protein
MAVSSAWALNVINEWGGHVLHGDYEIDFDPQIGDYGVRITANPHPEVPWRFEAYEDSLPEQPPGDIDYISIDSTVPVGDIVLSVIGDQSMGHDRGARALKSLDLVNNGSGNIIDVVDITDDFGALGPMRAPIAGALTIGHDVLNEILVSDIGTLTIGGRLAAGLECDTLGDTVIAELDGGSLVCGSLGNLTLGDAEHLTHSGYIGINDVMGYNRSLYINGSLNGEIYLQHGLTSWGRIEATEDLGTVLSHGVLSPASHITVGRDLGYLQVLSSANGHVWVGNRVTDPDTGLRITGDVADTGRIDVGGDATRLTVGGNFAGVFWAVGRVDYLGISGAMSRTVHSDSTFASMLFESGIAEGAIVEADSVNSLTVLSEAVEGTVVATQSIVSAALHAGIAQGGLVEAAEIKNMIVDGAIDGTLRASGELSGQVGTGGIGSTGLVDIGLLSGTLDVDDVVGEIDVQQDVLGVITTRSSILPGPFDADLIGSLHVFGSVYGSIAVNGSVRGSLVVEGVLGDDPENPLSRGHITVTRSLLDNAAITIGTNYTVTTEFISIHYSGFEDGDSWDPNAVVTVNGIECHGDTPALNVRRCSPCKGDMDGNGIVDFDDINWFVSALTDPAGYSLALPGLGGTFADNYESGSRVFHGDCNCDELLDFDDINPFIARLSMECDPGCPGDEQMMGAPQLAAGIRAHVPAGRLPALRAFVTQVIAHHANHPVQRAYWQQVLTRLSQ